MSPPAGLSSYHLALAEGGVGLQFPGEGRSCATFSASSASDALVVGIASVVKVGFHLSSEGILQFSIDF